eukprot:CAMPEP_0172182052 /NCGR_PEP_ID=MMETSP1050-20130122/18177_1 /TAXON_ID=233186 /ORGANISM="Cryptomonas curvata, Strain CCAP979/52" /LENGTH=419 /DNA_ID=CAMNT_0012855439 /DNA_START=164 /DNA_END=1423 /DNA_ORIENTATION=-
MHVSTEMPFPVLDVDCEILRLFGFEISELQGQSIFQLLGAKSDRIMLQDAIRATTQSISSVNQFTLYDRNGECRALMVSCSPFFQQDCSISCLMNLEISDAISLSEAFEESYCPHVLVSTDYPHMVHMVNERFSEKIGCAPSQALGQALHNIQGLDQENWGSILAAASNGRVVRGSMRIYNPRFQFACAPGTDDVICVPVVEAPNGKVRHILVLFTPAEHETTESDDSPDSDRTSSPHTASASPPAEHSDRLPTILPRRKLCTNGTIAQAAPVVVTPELLDRVRGLPLKRAAEAVGVSPTAFKKACRKLGVCRWAYQRAPGKRGPYMRYRNSIGRGATDSAAPSADPAPFGEDAATAAANRPASAPVAATRPAAAHPADGWGLAGPAEPDEWLLMGPPAVDERSVLAMFDLPWEAQPAL